MESYKITKLQGHAKECSSTLSGIMGTLKNGKEKFLFVSPHDDDVILGSGLMMQLAIKEGFEVYILIVTDGSMGYCTEEEKNTITQIRRKETYNCYEELGVPNKNIIWLGFPDCRINLFRGKRQAIKSDPAVIKDYTGLQNAFTWAIRTIQPTRCFVPTLADLHPDHQIVYEEFMISIFHANGTIWPELGQPLNEIPDVYEMGIYCDFPHTPDIQIAASQAYLERKIDAINEFKSQTQISAIIDIVRENGPYEYFRTIGFNLYSPAKYKALFE